MDKKDKHITNEEKNNIHISITYGEKSLTDCMKNIIRKKVIQNYK